MKKLPKTEYQVMQFIWKQKTPKVASRDIAYHMTQTLGWLKPTTGKVLSRLVDKEFLKVEKIGRHLTYMVLIKQDDYIKFETEEFFNLVHNRSLSNMVSALGASDSLSDDDINELEDWIKSRRST